MIGVNRGINTNDKPNGKDVIGKASTMAKHKNRYVSQADNEKTTS